MDFRVRNYVLLTIVIFSITAGACQTVPAQKGLLEERIEESQITTKQLRLLLNEFVVRFSDQVEEGADEIIARSPDPVVRRNALLWKINAIPACFRAAFIEDPLAAYLDVWVLTLQMLQFLEDDPGNTLFGPFQSIAVDTSRRLEGEVLDIARTITDSEERLKRGESLAKSFAEKSPIENLSFARKSVVSWYIEQIKTEGQMLFEVVGDLSQSLSALQELLTLYANFLPNQARWQAELLLSDITRNEGVSKAMKDFSDISASVDRVAVVAEALPGLIREERKATVEELRKELIASFDQIEQMRVASFQDLTSERIAAFAQIAIEREAAMKEIGAITGVAMDGMLQEGKTLIDHFFWRAFQLGVVFAVFGLILLILWYLFVRKRRDIHPG